ncbi:MAG: hypothetical protein E6J91_06715 [Deltaproteobacteria bacterium]|nr:MAG: hypothetical protein E6J91_06715 [Deltaproteobacteria bacterium]
MASRISRRGPVAVTVLPLGTVIVCAAITQASTIGVASYGWHFIAPASDVSIVWTDSSSATGGTSTHTLTKLPRQTRELGPSLPMVPSPGAASSGVRDSQFPSRHT